MKAFNTCWKCHHPFPDDRAVEKFKVAVVYNRPCPYVENFRYSGDLFEHLVCPVVRIPRTPVPRDDRPTKPKREPVN